VTFVTYRNFPLIEERRGTVSLDQSKIGSVVAKQMEALEADYGDDCEIGDVCTIVEVLGPHGSHLRVRSSDLRPHITIGLLRASEGMFLNGFRPGAGTDE
jgi:hypothetical protein